MALHQSQLAIVLAAFIGPVFNFDANRSTVSSISENRKELAPIDVTHAGQLGDMVLIGMSENPKIVQAMLINSDVFCVDVEQLVSKFTHWL